MAATADAPINDGTGKEVMHMTEPFGTESSLTAARDRARLIITEIESIEKTLSACLEQVEGEEIDAASAARLRGRLGGVNAQLRNSADELNALASRIQRIREGLRSIQDRSQSAESKPQ
jgi:hypothetical protein